MAFATDEWLETWSRSTTIELRQKSIMLTLLSKEGTDSWVSGSSAVHIPKPTYTNAAAAARARGGDWQTADQIAQDTVEFARIGGGDVSNEVLAEDALEIPWPLIDGLRNRQSYELSKYADDEIYKWIIGTDGLAATQDVSYGTDTNKFISRVAPYGPGGNNNTNIALARGLVFDAIKGVELKLQRANALDGVGDAVGQKWMIMPPELFVSLRDYMFNQKQGWDLLTADLLRTGSVLASAEFQGRLFGIDIFTWNGIAIPTGTANWKMLAGVRAGAYANVRPVLNQFFSPSENQVSTKPAYLSRMTMEFAAAIGEGSVFSR